MKCLYSLVGMKHRGTEKLVASLPAGEPLTLNRERHNAFDPNAVQVWARDQHIGYIAAKQVKPIAIAMDAALEKSTTSFTAVLRATPDRWPMIEIEE